MIHPATDALDGPPDPENGRIVDVAFDKRIATAGRDTRRECQNCGQGVHLGTEHIQAFVRIEGRIGPRHYRPVFCSKDCWSDWATC